MRIQVNGIEYSNFNHAVATIRLDALSNTFNFGATSEKGNPLPFKGGEECAIIVSGEKVITGFIEIIDVDYDSGSHSISIQGRDKTADLIDSTIGFNDLRGNVAMLSFHNCQ